MRPIYQLWGLCLLDPEGSKLRLKCLKLKDLVTVKEFAWAYSNRPTDIILLILEVDLDKQVLRGIVDDLEFEMEAAAKRAWDCLLLIAAFPLSRFSSFLMLIVLIDS